MAKHETTELTEQAVERITASIRSLIEDKVDRGIDLGRPVHCDSCDQDRPPNGAVVYGAYKLCNDCLLDFTLQLASGRATSVAEYMTRRPEDGGAMPSQLTEPHDLSSFSRPAIQPRDKLMPSNEPC